MASSLPPTDVPALSRVSPDRPGPGTPAPAAPTPAAPTSSDDPPAALVRRANAASARTIFTPARTPAQTFADLAAACERLGLGADTGGTEAWDVYDEGGAVALLEREVRELLGTEDCAFFPSGIMAQQAALRVHVDSAGSRRVVLPDLSHLLVHEEDGPRLLQDLRLEPLTRGARTPTRADLDAVPGRLGAVLVELPLREPGCLLPTWEELVDLSAACRERGVALHVDGARLWESLVWFDHTAAEVAALADTIYVSFYKGLGGLAGAALAGRRATIAEARLWRRRMGGTIYHQTAEAVAALQGLRECRGLIPGWVRWARELARSLPGSLTTSPDVPQTNQFLVHAPGDPDTLNVRLLRLTEEADLAFCRPWRAAGEPGRSVTEVAVGRGSADVATSEVAELFARLVPAGD